MVVVTARRASRSVGDSFDADRAAAPANGSDRPLPALQLPYVEEEEEEQDVLLKKAAGQKNLHVIIVATSSAPASQLENGCGGTDNNQSRKESIARRRSYVADSGKEEHGPLRRQVSLTEVVHNFGKRGSKKKLAPPDLLGPVPPAAQQPLINGATSRNGKGNVIAGMRRIGSHPVDMEGLEETAV